MTASDYIGLNWYLLNSDFNNSNKVRGTEEIIYYELPILHNFIPSKYNNGSIYKLFLSICDPLDDIVNIIDPLVIQQCVFYSLAYKYLTPFYTDKLFYNILYIIQEYRYTINEDKVDKLCLSQFYNYVLLIQNIIKSHLKLNMDNVDNMKITIDEIGDGYEDSNSYYKPMRIILKKKEC